MLKKFSKKSYFIPGNLRPSCRIRNKRSYLWFDKLNPTPNIIWQTPRITDIFIFNELVKVILFCDNCHI